MLNTAKEPLPALLPVVTNCFLSHKSKSSLNLGFQLIVWFIENAMTSCTVVGRYFNCIRFKWLVGCTQAFFCFCCWLLYLMLFFKVVWQLFSDFKISIFSFKIFQIWEYGRFSVWQFCTSLNCLHCLHLSKPFSHLLFGDMPLQNSDVLCQRLESR